jgi:hypothetical protein
MPEYEIRQQLTALFSRMGAASATDAVAAACRRGLIPTLHHSHSEPPLRSDPSGERAS